MVEYLRERYPSRKLSVIAWCWDRPQVGVLERFDDNGHAWSNAFRFYPDGRWSDARMRATLDDAAKKLARWWKSKRTELMREAQNGRT